MKKLIQNIKNIWSVKDLRNRIGITLFLVLIFRIGTFIILPGVDSAALAASESKSGGALQTILSIFSGGAFSQASILSLGIMPYISASIIMQLLGMAVPQVQKMQNDGEAGRKKINMYTRIGTIVICALQAPSYLAFMAKDAIPKDDSFGWWTQTILLLIAGSMFAVWLGERITEKGIGNGISVLITVGILARFPLAVGSEFANTSNLLLLFLELIVFFFIIMGTILVVQGVRKIPLNFAGRIVGARAAGTDAARQYLPIKVNASGVMPIIFAQAIMTASMALPPSWGYGDAYGAIYNITLAILIIVFTFVYTAIMINPRKMADDLKKGGGYIPDVKPGEDTQTFIDALVSRITLPGALFLAIIAILPALARLAGVGDQFAMFFGGTSLLIMVGVVLDTLQQIETYLVNNQMDGLMDGGTRIRGRKELA
jgi:preprotein translocase subunit SecY